MRSVEYFLIPFSLFWTGFVVVWNAGVWGTDAPLLFNLVGAAFLIVGLYFVAGRFLVDNAMRKQTRYFVTDQRILIVRGETGPKVKSLDIKRLPALEFDEQSDGVGTIRFGAQPTWLSLFNATGGLAIWQPMLESTPQFLRVPEVRALYRLIQEQART